MPPVSPARSGVAAPTRRAHAHAAITPAQKNALVDIIQGITNTRVRGRQIAQMFMELPDRELYPDYYQYIPNPSSLTLVRKTLENNGFTSIDSCYGDLELVFLNAMHYNESSSTIYHDAQTLRTKLDTLWAEAVDAGTLPPPPKYATLPAAGSSTAMDRSESSGARGQTSSPSTLPSPLPARKAGRPSRARLEAERSEATSRVGHESENNPATTAEARSSSTPGPSTPHLRARQNTMRSPGGLRGSPWLLPTSPSVQSPMGSGPMSPHPLPQQMPQLGGMPAFSQANMQFGLQQPSYPAFFGQQPNPQQRHQPHDPRMLPSSQQMLGVSYGAQAGLPGYAGMPEGANQPGFNQYSPMGLQMAGMGGGETSISAQGGSVAGSDTPGWRGSVPPGTPGGGGGGGGGGPSGAPMTPSLSFGVGIGAGGAGPASSSGMSGGKGKGRGAAENEVRMPDPNDKGWMPEPINADEAERTYLAILHKVYEYRDKEGKRLAEPLERCPDPDKDPSYYELIEKPTSLSAIQQRVKNREYPTAVDFEMDMLQLFENARRSFPLGGKEYGEMLILQRLYQQLTRSHPSPSETNGEASAASASTVAAAAEGADASRNFSSMPFGPGQATAGVDGELTTRISSKKKTFYEYLSFKGKTFRVGDWVHLMNPSDPSRPIVAHIFKVCKRDDSPGQSWVTVCWYFRPEQTVHPPSRTFFEDEVFKTGYFADHQIEDILEKIFVMFYTKFIRGRPKAEFWDPRSPLYVIEHRYNEQQKVFNKIKSWASCVPEEIRKVDTPMDLFDKPIPPPAKQDSPFLRGITGPGSLCEEKTPPTEPHEFPDLFKASEEPAGQPPKKKKRSKEREKGPDILGAGLTPGGRPHAAGPGGTSPVPPSANFTALATQVAQRVSPADYGRLQQILSGPGASSVDLVQLSASMGGVDPSLLASLRSAVQGSTVGVLNGAQQQPGAHHQHGMLGQQAQTQPPFTPLPTSGPEFPTGQDGRSLAALMAAQKGEGLYESLPPETQALFAQDPTTGQVLWYPAPPLDGPVQHAAQQHLMPATAAQWYGMPPAHSLEYLYHQALRNSDPHVAAAPGQLLASAPQDTGPTAAATTPRALAAPPHHPHMFGVGEHTQPVPTFAELLAQANVDSQRSGEGGAGNSHAPTGGLDAAHELSFGAEEGLTHGEAEGQRGLEFLNDLSRHLDPSGSAAYLSSFLAVDD